MSAYQEEILTNTIRGFGYTDVWTFAREQARNLVLQKIRSYQNRIDYFQEKYGMDYGKFCAQFHTIETPLFEREDDSIEWETALAVIKFLQLQQEHPST